MGRMTGSREGGKVQSEWAQDNKAPRNTLPSSHRRGTRCTALEASLGSRGHGKIFHEAPQGSDYSLFQYSYGPCMEQCLSC